MSPRNWTLLELPRRTAEPLELFRRLSVRDDPGRHTSWPSMREVQDVNDGRWLEIKFVFVYRLQPKLSHPRRHPSHRDTPRPFNRNS